MNDNAKPITELTEHRLWDRPEATRFWIRQKRMAPEGIHAMHIPTELVGP